MLVRFADRCDVSTAPAPLAHWSSESAVPCRTHTLHDPIATDTSYSPRAPDCELVCGTALPVTAIMKFPGLEEFGLVVGAPAG